MTVNQPRGFFQLLCLMKFFLLYLQGHPHIKKAELTSGFQRKLITSSESCPINLLEGVIIKKLK